MFTQKLESDFFLKHITKISRVLEYGSGESTLEIANLCGFILSIDHQPIWYNKVVTSIPNNATVLLKEPNLPYVEGTTNCGTYDEFKDYIESPNKYEKFDII